MKNYLGKIYFYIPISVVMLLTNVSSAGALGLAPDNITYPADTPSVILSWPAFSPSHHYTLRVIDETDPAARSFGNTCQETAYFCLTNINVTAISIPVYRNHSYTWQVVADDGKGLSGTIYRARFSLAKPVETEPFADTGPVSPLATILLLPKNSITFLLSFLGLLVIGTTTYALYRFVTSRFPEEETLLSHELTTPNMVREKIE